MLKDIKNPQETGVAGWIINEVEGGHEVVFFGQAPLGQYALWSGVYDGKKVRSKTRYGAGERMLTAKEKALVEARGLPDNTDLERCSEKPFNTVVMPTDKDDGSLFVYFLVPQEKANLIPFGGHYRFEVKDGAVVNSRKFTNSCISLSNRGPNGEKPAATAISHSLDDTPTEIHVFSMYAMGNPVAVILSETDKVWMISDTKDGPVMGTIALSSRGGQ